MAAIAGIVHLSGSAPIPHDALGRMSGALAHRGAYTSEHVEPGVGLAWRHDHFSTSSSVTIAATPDFPVTAVCDGHITNISSLREQLTALGRESRSGQVGEWLAHLWEVHGDVLADKLRGQFACAVWDRRKQALYLCRDRVGMTPLYWAKSGAWLLFASEVKGILASGLVERAVDVRGIDQVFTFMGLPAARTCFHGIQALPGGHWLLAKEGNVQISPYWDLDFPDRGGEETPASDTVAADELQAILERAVMRRLEGSDSVASYISGGIDCSTLAALARKVQGRPIACYTVRIETPHLDESDRARRVAQAAGTEPIIESFSGERILPSIPRLIEAADAPVLDPSCVTLMLLAERVRRDGLKVVFAGDGADDLFAGYAWFKTDKVLRALDVIPGFPFGKLLRRIVLRITAPHIHANTVRRTQAIIGGHNAWLDLYGLISLNRSRFYSAEMKATLGDHIAHEDLLLNRDRMQRWHPLNRALYFGMKSHVPGLLLQAKGDRIAMQSGVELRCPYLDEEVIDYSARLAPDWKLRRLRDKYILRRVAERFLPHDIAWRPKRDFVAHFDNLYRRPAPEWVEDLLSESALRGAGYFDPAAVHYWRDNYQKLSKVGSRRFSVEIGLSAVVATQLWHRMYVENKRIA